MSTRPISEIPVIDFEVIRFLRSLDRDASDDYLQRLVDLHLEQNAVDLAELQAVAVNEDLMAVIHQVRFIRQRNQNLGCLRMVHYLDQVSILAARDPVALTGLFTTLLEKSELVSLALTELTGAQALPSKLNLILADV